MRYNPLLHIYKVYPCMETDLSIYFTPAEFHNEDYGNNTIGSKLHIYHKSTGFPDLEGVQLAFIGVKEDRAAVGNKGCGEAPDEVRRFLYPLFAGQYELNMADFGNILPGNSIQDTYFALAAVVEHCVRRQIIPIIIGGGQDLTYANYAAYEKLEQVVNLVAIDSKLDVGTIDSDLDSTTFLNRIILHQPSYLFNYSNLGYQTYFADQEMLDLMGKLYFDLNRLGEVKANLQAAEPVIRNADIITFDVSAIRQSDAPGNRNTTPNGFYGEDACQLARYAGLSDKATSFGIYEINPAVDHRGQTAHLAAQMVWYFIEGFYSRKRDFPIGNKKDFLKYRVSLQESGHELVFFKSKKSDRWWMDVPYPPNHRVKFERHHLVPCTYADYQEACKDEMPDRWWRTYQKLF